jgi:hypothetical protein
VTHVVSNCCSDLHWLPQVNKIVRYHLLMDNDGCLRKHVHSLLYRQYSQSTLLELAQSDSLELQARLLREQKQCADIIRMIARYNNLPSAAQLRWVRPQAAQGSITKYAMSSRFNSLSDPGIAAREPAAAVSSPSPTAGGVPRSPPVAGPGTPAGMRSPGANAYAAKPYGAGNYDVIDIPFRAQLLE